MTTDDELKRDLKKMLEETRQKRNLMAESFENLIGSKENPATSFTADEEKLATEARRLMADLESKYQHIEGNISAALGDEEPNSTSKLKKTKEQKLGEEISRIMGEINSSMEGISPTVVPPTSNHAEWGLAHAQQKPLILRILITTVMGIGAFLWAIVKGIVTFFLFEMLYDFMRGLFKD